MNKKLTIFLTATVFFLMTGGTALMAQIESSTGPEAVRIYEEGRGRADMTLAILRPEGEGLSIDEEKYLGIIQGALFADFSRFSAIQLIDPLELHNILEQDQLEQIKLEQQRQQQALSVISSQTNISEATPSETNDSESEDIDTVYAEMDFPETEDPETLYAETHYPETHYAKTGSARIGELANSRYLLKGTLTKKGMLYSLNLSFVDAETDSSLGAFRQDSLSLKEIANAAVARAPVAYFLGLPEVNVILTIAGQDALGIMPSADELEAQIALALSYEASINGYHMDALIYSYIATAANKDLLAAKNQAVNTLKTISSGGTAIREDIKQQAYWKNNLIAFENFYRTHTPFELYHTPVPIQKGFIDFDKGTVDWEFTVGLRQRGIKTMQKALKDVLKELKKTNAKKNRWGFDNWPFISAESARLNQKRTEFFEGFSTFSVKAVLVNNSGEIISTIEFPLYGQILLKSNNSIGAFATQERKMVFTIDGALTTENMQIRIVSINDIDVDKANADSYLKNTVVEKLPPRIAATIPQKGILVPVLPEDREKQLEIIAKRREKEAYWSSKELEIRKNINAMAVFNPQNGDEALSLEAGLGYGYRNFSVDGRLVYPMTPMMNAIHKDDSLGFGLVTGVGLVAGYSYLWDYFIAGLEGGATYYIVNDSDGGAFLPMLEAKFDFIPGKKGLSLRAACKLEFNTGIDNDFAKWYLGSSSVLASPTVGIVIWY